MVNENTEQETLPVTQADINAAISTIPDDGSHSSHMMVEAISGVRANDWPLVQAFARHRADHEPRAVEVVTRNLRNLREQMARIAEKHPNDQPAYKDGVRPFGTGDLRHFIETLDAAATALAAQSPAPTEGWQDIASAPTDGRDALVGCWVVNHDEPEKPPVWSAWDTIFDGGPIGCDGAWGDPPTHWHDMPAPPLAARPSTQPQADAGSLGEGA